MKVGITLDDYVTTDCLLQNKRGRGVASNLPSKPCNLVYYKQGDVLIANIRPYLKKIWFADRDGGASSDVLVFRAKDGHSSKFLYATLLQDSFFDYVMQGTKGSKMPRGDKEQIMRYDIQPHSASEDSIGKFILDICKKINLNKQINQNLEALAKQFYDHWFVQFDFPDENDKPYKSSGGRMVWNDILKRHISQGWEVKLIGDYADLRKGTTITNAQTRKGNIKVVAAATNYSFLHDTPNREAYVITVSSSGANAGYINFWREPIYASDCSTVQGKSIVETIYCYYWLLHFQEYIFNMQIGAAQPHVYPEHIGKIPIVIPPAPILKKIAPLLQQSNVQQSVIEKSNENLVKQRDELLPLLMNGQASLNSDLSHG